MKICVITVPDSSNFGSFLQAYGMKKFLEAKGHHVEFYQTRNSKYVQKLFYNNKMLFRCIIKRPLIGILEYLYGKKSYEIYKKEWAREFKIVNSELEEYDLIILGSDEIWNIKNRIFKNELFFGNGLQNVIAYAVSCGSSNIEDFSNENSIISCMKKLFKIMVRDSNTEKIVQHYLGIKTDNVCDPTILINSLTYEKNSHIEIPKHNYLLIYSYVVSRKMRKLIKNFAKQNKLRIVSVGFYMNWADENINCSPLELYILCKNAKYIYTSTFHGTVFATISNSIFVSMKTASVAKVSDFLYKMDLGTRLIDENIAAEKFNELMLTSINYTEVNRKIALIRKESEEKFVSALEEFVEVKDNVM